MKMGLGAQIEVLNTFNLEKFTSGTHQLPQIFNTPKMCEEFSNSSSSSSNGVVSTISAPPRSTKGASKQRRDLINGEIGNLRDMLPLPESARQRLSQLQIMSLACCYIRKCNYFARLFGDSVYASGTPFEFSQAMTGFLLITTREGKLLYISDNVTEYLGHSMVDMLTQGDSLYDIIDKRDHSSVQTQLLQTSYNPCPDTGLDARTFFCRMNVSRSFRRQAGFGDHKVMHVRGHFIQPLIRDHYGNQPVFMATCAPLITPDAKETASSQSTLVFQSVHGLDMKYIEIAQNGSYHLGYSNTEIAGKSWYELLHPEDVVEAKEKHMQLIKSSHEMGCMLTVRLLSQEGNWVWVNMVMHIRQPYICDNGDPAIVCINQIISDSEANLFKMQSQLESSHIARSPEFLDPIQGAGPSQIITQVASDAEQLQSMPLLRLLNEPTTYYEAQVAITTAPSGGDSGSGSGVGSPGQGSQQLSAGGGGVQMTSSPTGGGSHHSQGGSPDSGSDGSGSPREILRAEIINRMNLKRSAMSNQACKPPAKQPKLSHSSSGGSGGFPGGLGITGSVFIAPASGVGHRRGAQAPGNGGEFGSGTQVFAPMAPGSMFAGLSLKKEVLIPETVKMQQSSDFMQPLTPPTPASSDRSDSPGTTMTQTGFGSLRVDTTTDPLLPLSLLTPESSPTMKDFGTATGLGEQQVPGDLTELEEALKFMQAEAVEPLSLLKPAEIKLEKKEVDPVSGLPELDTVTIEDYFNAVDRKSGFRFGLKVDIKAEPLSPPQSSAGCPSPAPTSPASSAYTESIASPASQYASSSLCASPRSVASPACQSTMSPATSVYSSVMSPASSISSSMSVASPQQQMAAEVTTSDDVELSSLVNTVAEAIYNMVNNNNNSNSLATAMGAGFSSSPSCPSRSGDDNKKLTSSDDVTSDEDVEMTAVRAHDALPEPDPLAEAALIDELHQLDQLANAAPSYGDAASLGSFFDETL